MTSNNKNPPSFSSNPCNKCHLPEFQDVDINTEQIFCIMCNKNVNPNQSHTNTKPPANFCDMCHTQHTYMLEFQDIQNKHSYLVPHYSIDNHQTIKFCENCLIYNPSLCKKLRKYLTENKIVIFTIPIINPSRITNNLDNYTYEDKHIFYFDTEVTS